MPNSLHNQRLPTATGTLRKYSRVARIATASSARLAASRPMEAPTALSDVHEVDTSRHLVDGGSRCNCADDGLMRRSDLNKFVMRDLEPLHEDVVSLPDGPSAFNSKMWTHHAAAQEPQRTATIRVG